MSDSGVELLEPQRIVDLVPNKPSVKTEQEQKDWQQAYEIALKKLGPTFPIYRTMFKEELRKDLMTFGALGNPTFKIPPQDPIEVIGKYVKESGTTLTGLAWQHAEHPLNDDPMLSWTTDLDIARRYIQKRWKYTPGSAVIVQAEGTLLPPELKSSIDLKPNQVVFIPALSEVKGQWPSEPSKTESEAVSFGNFPVEMYKVVEEI